MPSSRSSGKKIDDDGNANSQIDAGDYDVWRANFGQTAGSGAGAVIGSSGASPSHSTVPEPGSWLAFIMVFVLFAAKRWTACPR